MSSNQDIKTNVANSVCRRRVRACSYLACILSTRFETFTELVFGKSMSSSRCVVQGCNNTSNPRAGISLHNSAKSSSLLAQWKRFVSTSSANFSPTGRFVVCSDHFSEDCFARSLHVEGSMKRLESGSVPTIWKKNERPNTSTSSCYCRTVSKFRGCFFIVNNAHFSSL